MICNCCGHLYICDEKSGTRFDIRKYPYILKKDNQKTICFDIKKEIDEYGKVVSQLKTHSFDFEKCKKALTKMIIRDELPFQFMEGDEFRKFCNIMEPKFIVPSRMTIARDCMKLLVKRA